MCANYVFSGYEHIREAETIITPEETDAFVASVMNVSEEEHSRVKNLPQHDEDGTTNDDWIEARRYRFTGSAAGSFGHQNPWQSCAAYVSHKVTPVEMDARGKEYTAWGNKNEDNCEASFMARYIAEELYENTRNNGDVFVDAKIHHLGLYICKRPAFQMLGMSPDGILQTIFRRKEDGELYSVYALCEWKCPATYEKKFENPHIYKSELLPKTFPTRLQSSMGRLPPTENDVRYRLPVPPQYFAQVQYGMALFRASGINIEHAWFGVWAPTVRKEMWRDDFTEEEMLKHSRCAVTFVKRDDEYGEWILNQGKQVWINEFVPMYLKRQKIESKFASSTSKEAIMDESEDVSDWGSMFSGFKVNMRMQPVGTSNQNGKRVRLE